MSQHSNKDNSFNWGKFFLILFSLGAVLAAIAVLQRGRSGSYSALQSRTTIGDHSSAQKLLAPSLSLDLAQEELPPSFNTEEYNQINEQPFQSVKLRPLSTFSIDVDTASYSNIRRFINMGQWPPEDAVRIEEMINYFTYDYPAPVNNIPFSVTTEVSQAPWQPKHQLVLVGVQGKSIPQEQLPPSNLVFLLDVSGSMSYYNKLPLLKSAFKLLVSQLDEKDTISIVVYAGSAGVVLPPTPGDQKEKIIAALEKLQAGGSTAGGEGIKLAYQLAQTFYLESGNNRVILATDGDFNVGTSSEGELVNSIEQYRNDNIFLTVLGFGMGNYKDNKMEQLANKGNGNYAYIDNLPEARKVLVSEMGGTLVTIAKDVKIQVEFNPAKVQAYRLIGYENRRLNDQDFNDDQKDAGELGAGHSVTALYEVIPVGVKSEFSEPNIDSLRYQDEQMEVKDSFNDELMLVKLRYKLPKGTESQLISQPILASDINLNNASNNLKFAAAVAEFGMLLRGSDYAGDSNFNQVLELAQSSQGEDKQGYRRDFIKLVELSQPLSNQQR
ncbi:MAG: von Willebrand factor type A domain-containing protein [Microcystaceae cyanobacterium]